MSYSEPKYDIQKKQIDDRIIHLEGNINEETASYMTQVLLHLSELDPTKPIQVFINSGGGSVIDGFAIINVMQSIAAPVYTCAKGMAASMAALILSAGEKGFRYSLPDSVIMIHEGSTGSQGTTSNFKSYSKFSERIEERANKLLAKTTGKTIKQIQKDTIIDLWMFPEDAIEYGLIDKVVTSL